MLLKYPRFWRRQGIQQIIRLPRPAFSGTASCGTTKQSRCKNRLPLPQIAELSWFENPSCNRAFSRLQIAELGDNKAELYALYLQYYNTTILYRPFSTIYSAKSTTRFEYPHSLSYQDRTLTKLPSITFVDKASTIELA